MKKTYYIVLLGFVSALLLGSCKDETEQLSQISFAQQAITVDENAGSIKIALVCTEPLNSPAQITLGVTNATAEEDTHFLITKKLIEIPAGATTADVEVQITDDQEANDDRTFNLSIQKITGGGYAAVDKQTCEVTITDNDYQNRTVRFAQTTVGDGLWHEDAGTLEVSLIFENGVSAGHPIQGKIVVDSFTGCTRDDFQLETTEFSSPGNETQSVKIAVRDNEVTGDWTIVLALTDLEGAEAANDKFEVKVKDDERILGFKQIAYSVNEGSSVNIIAALYGGNAASDIPISIEVVADQTTALREQYTLPSSYNPISKNSSESQFSLTTHSHSSRGDKVLTLKVTTTAGTTTPGKILTDNTQICKVTIKNTDSYIGFKQNQVTNLQQGINNISLATSGYDEDVMIYVNLKSSTMDNSAYQLISDFIRIPAGMKSGNIQLKLNTPMAASDQITLEITRVVLANSGEMNEEIDPDSSTCVCKGAAAGL